MKPLAVDLCAGLGGWSEGLLAEGWDVVGFDIKRHQYGTHRYPAQLVLQDILTLGGRQFRGRVSLIVASPPCQKYSYMAMPWTRAKALAVWYRDPQHPERLVELNALVDACHRIAREAECPFVMENVRGAQPWIGRAKWMYGSFALWGDVPALMPIVMKHRMKFPADCRPRLWSEREYVRLNDGNASAFHHEGATKNDGGSWFAVANNTTSGHGQNPVNGVKCPSESGRRTDIGLGARFTTRDCGMEAEGVKQRGSGREWFAGDSKISRMTSSHSSARKAASAHIAKIPLALSKWIAKCYYP